MAPDCLVLAGDGLEAAYGEAKPVPDPWRPVTARSKWLIVLLFSVVLGGVAVGLWPARTPGLDTRRLQAQSQLALAGALPVTLTPIASGFAQPTDLRWLPDQNLWIVLEKAGNAWWLTADGTARGKLLHLDVATDSEEGLLGIAPHPQFAQNHLFFLNYVVRVDGHDFTRIARWRLDGDVRTGHAAPVDVLLEVAQPYGNHKGGQLQFGPDGRLYIGLGDGGAGGDPHGNGQNPSTLLGKMLRIDVDHADPGRAYAVPSDNPFVGQAGWRPEIWALGLRNPWRFSFDATGRLIVADVGQNLWEELDIVPKGANLGWNRREGRHCFPPAATCQTAGLTEPAALTEPIVEYGHEDGQSITGGYVALGPRVPQLRGRYILADFANGALWAVDLPQTVTQTARVWSLGKSTHHIATFGRDGAGDLLAADVFSGEILRLDP